MDFRAGHQRARYERRAKDRQAADRGPAERREAPLAVIRWRNKDGTEAGGHPLPRQHAEALLRAFQSQFPLPSFWLETPPALDDAVRYLSGSNPPARENEG
jgi:hypothetical protein